MNLTIEQFVEIAEKYGVIFGTMRYMFTPEQLYAYTAEVQRRTLREAAELLDITPRGDFPEDQLRRMADEIEG